MYDKSNLKLHDTYAISYDQQVKDADCFIAEVLFGLAYEFISPGQKLLDIGIGTGISSMLFAKAGLEIHGIDFSSIMLEICQAKQIATRLIEHDICSLPWPLLSDKFEVIICCGLFHFFKDFEFLIDEALRFLPKNGILSFTTKFDHQLGEMQSNYIKQVVEGFEIYSHRHKDIELISQNKQLVPKKKQNCFIGEDIFTVWVMQKNGIEDF